MILTEYLAQDDEINIDTILEILNKKIKPYNVLDDKYSKKLEA